MIANARLDLPIAASTLAPAGAGLQSAAAGLARCLWAGLTAIGARRARAELLRVARLRETSDPQLAARLRQLVREDWLSRN